MIPFSRKNTVAFDDPLQKPLEPSLQIRFLLFLGLAASPHLIHMDMVFSGIFYALLFYRGFATFRPQLMPGKKFLLVLTFGALVLFFVRNHSFLGDQGGVALLLLMSGLKMLELLRRRDLHFSVLLGYFTVITVFLHDHSIAVALLMFIAVMGLTSILIDSSRISQPDFGIKGFKSAGLLALQALPIALVLFFLFPRIGAPLWSFDIGGKSAKTGLSETIKPGAFSRLIQSNEIAFRVLFDGAIPPPEQRYWRGPVMWRTDGRIWWRSSLMQKETKEEVFSFDDLKYTVFLEASDNPWVLLLDHPLSATVDGYLSQDFQMVTKKPVSEIKRYDAVSSINARPQDLDPMQKRLGLQLPEGITPRMESLVSEWKKDGASQWDIVNKALKYFNEEPFIYTLRPPRLGNNPTDQFLFETRKGFCEHYATSFTLMMRLAGIPSKLVSGYLGGEINPQGDYLIVRQSAAHAWSEVYLDNEGWIRVDPTAAVAPDRIERSIDIDSVQDDGASATFTIDNTSFLYRLGRNIRWGMDALNLSWHRWIIGYDRDRQKNFLSDIGFDFINNRTIAKLVAVAFAGLILAALFIFIRTMDREKIDKISKSYQLFCRRLAKIGITRSKHEGPLDFQQRIISLRPDLQSQIEPIFRAYISLVYGSPKKGWKDKFIRQVSAFRPKSS